MIIYGGSKETVKKQLKCKHNSWHGPFIDSISRYYKCADCYCFDRDCADEKDYYRLVREAEESISKEVAL